MSRLFTLTKKNLLRFVKNPKTLGFLIIIPVLYYLILGAIFGGVATSDGTTTYNVGWVDLDDSNATLEYYKLNTFYDIFKKNVSAINPIEFDSETSAQKAAESGDISSYVVFPQGFESLLENRSKLNIAFYNNDSTSSFEYSIAPFYSILETQFSDIFRIKNETENGEDVLVNFNETIYDSMIIVKDGFLAGLDNNWQVNISYRYREFSEAKLQQALGILNYTLQMVYQAKFANITIFDQLINNADSFGAIDYDIYFPGDISPATKAVLSNTINQVIEQTVNADPFAIELNLEDKPFTGKVINEITYAAPGYLLYGPMSILSFVLVVLTGEKKDGIFKRLSSTQVKNWEIILSNIFSSILLIFMQFVIGAVILSVFGWSPAFASVFDFSIGIIITMFLFSFFLLALAFALAPVFKDPDTAGGGVWIIIIPLAMVSGIFVPIELFGEAMQNIASVLPTRFAVVALQNILLNSNSILHPDVLLSWGLLTLYSAIIFVIGIKLFNKFVRST